MSWIRGEKQLKQHAAEMSTALILVKTEGPIFYPFSDPYFFHSRTPAALHEKKTNSFSRKLKLRLCCAFQMFARQKHGSRDNLSVCNKHLGGGCTTRQEVSVAGDPSPCFYVHFEVLHREAVMKTLPLPPKNLIRK